ncbi:MAG: zinc ribbon domain-containing protein [Rubrobacteraceae bacterium]|nr:zinc ribbon domain-containing protein [Rubrobacteraceae bacterium]
MADRFRRNCGHELSQGDKFCPNCGRPIQEFPSISVDSLGLLHKV